MAEAIHRLLNDDTLRHRIGAQAREQTLATNSLPAYAARLLALADEVVALGP
jgi:glycosyltransferase involved in cell wall biosynthesis